MMKIRFLDENVKHRLKKEKPTCERVLIVDIIVVNNIILRLMMQTYVLTVLKRSELDTTSGFFDKSERTCTTLRCHIRSSTCMCALEEVLNEILTMATLLEVIMLGRSGPGFRSQR